MAPQTSISTEPAVFWTLVNLNCEHHTKHRDLSQMWLYVLLWTLQKGWFWSETSRDGVKEGWMTGLWKMIFILMRQEKDNEDMFTLFLPPAVFQLIQTLTHTKVITLSPPSVLLLLINLDWPFKQVSVLRLSIFFRVFFSSCVMSRTWCSFICLPLKLTSAVAFCKEPIVKKFCITLESAYGYFYKFEKEVKHVVSLNKNKSIFLRRQVTLFEAARRLMTGALEYSEHRNHFSDFWLSRPRK